MNAPSSRPGLWLGLTALGSLAAVGAALVSQHVFGMEPCPWCVLQRVIFVAIALASLVGLVWRAAAGRMLSAVLVLLLAASGIAAALWQHFVAASSTSCNLTFADEVIGTLGLDAAWPDVFSPRASCADAAVDLLGLPYEFWSLALFMLAAGAALKALQARRA